MNQVMIEVLLNSIDEADILTFFIDPEENQGGYCVNLNSTSSQSELKQVFSALLKKLAVNEITLELKIEKNYTKGLYIDVCAEYINDLNKELKSTFEKLHKDLEEN